MKGILSLLLALGAMIGLFGQGLAFAAGPAWRADRVLASAPATEPCTEMEMAKKEPAKAPCKGLTLDCIAAMGCIIPLLAIDSPMIDAAYTTASLDLVSSSPTRLVGRSPPPEPEPPTRLI